MTLAQSPPPSCVLPKYAIRPSGRELYGGPFPRAEYLLWAGSPCPELLLVMVSQALESLASGKDWLKNPKLPPPRILMLQSFREPGRTAQNVQRKRGKLATLLPEQRTCEPSACFL